MSSFPLTVIFFKMGTLHQFAPPTSHNHHRPQSWYKFRCTNAFLDISGSVRNCSNPELFAVDRTRFFGSPRTGQVFFFYTEIHMIHWVHHQDCRIKLPFFFHKWSRKNAEKTRGLAHQNLQSLEKNRHDPPSRRRRGWNAPWLFWLLGYGVGCFSKSYNIWRSGRDSAHEMLRICSRNIMAYPKFGPLKTTAVDTLWTWSLLLRPILISCHSTKMALRITQGWIIYCKRSVWSACGWLKPPTGWGPQLWVGL